MSDPNIDKWWHSPQMVSVLWSSLTASWGFIWRILWQIRKNTLAIAKLEQWKRDMGGNGK